MKKKILLLYKAYPFAIASYFRKVLEARPDVELTTCGEFFGQEIPWNNGMTIPRKYFNHVDFPIPKGMNKLSWKILKSKLQKDFDLILNVDAGFHLADKPDIPYAVVATDPHVLQGWYDEVRPIADYFFNMQRYYMQDGDIHLPYACLSSEHYAMSNVEKKYDAALIGLHYGNRDNLVRRLRESGLNVYYDIGAIWKEYREINNSATVGLNWSSLYDINARTFEMMAMMQVPVINRLPHLDELGLHENQHYLGFSDVSEAVEKVKWALANPNQARAISLSAHNHVHKSHTYAHRVQQILDTVL